MNDRALERDATRLKVVHRQRVMHYGDAEETPPFSPAEFSDGTVALAASGWQRLLDTEYESVVIAGWMTSALVSSLGLLSSPQLLDLFYRDLAESLIPRLREVGVPIDLQ
jgi:hypothetical protein